MSCKKQDGGQVDISACLKLAGPMPPLTQTCQLPCQDDCQLTAWSKFSSCAADCVGVRTRRRALVGECGISCTLCGQKGEKEIYCIAFSVFFQCTAASIYTCLMNCSVGNDKTLPHNYVIAIYRVAVYI